MDFNSTNRKDDGTATTEALKDTTKRKPAKSGKAGGRPELYTPKLAAEICERLAIGETLTRICQDRHMPSRQTVTRWLTDESKTDFLEKYSLARELQADHWADELIEIADDSAGDWGKRDDGEGNEQPSSVNHEHIQRSKVRIETRQWIIERLNPKKYGRKTELKHDVGDAFAKLWQMVGSGDRTGAIPEGKA